MSTTLLLLLLLLLPPLLQDLGMWVFKLCVIQIDSAHTISNAKRAKLDLAHAWQRWLLRIGILWVMLATLLKTRLCTNVCSRIGAIGLLALPGLFNEHWLAAGRTSLLPFEPTAQTTNMEAMTTW